MAITQCVAQLQSGRLGGWVLGSEGQCQKCHIWNNTKRDNLSGVAHQYAACCNVSVTASVYTREKKLRNRTSYKS